jgi:hypothetical protein
MTIRVVSCVFCAVVLQACVVDTTNDPSSEKVELAVDGSAATLTPKAKDGLFLLTLVKSPHAYALADISIDAQLPGESGNALNFTHEDVNENGLVDSGDRLHCTEPPVNLYDEDLVGKTLTVNFAVKQDGTYFQRGSTTWKVGN